MKRSGCQSSLLAFGVKRTRNDGDNSLSDIQGESVPADDADRDEADGIDAEAMEYSSDCCKPDCDTPNQPTCRLVLANTKRVRSHQARYVQSSWFITHPWLTL